MGWVIRRVDGTYRVWNANTQDDVLAAGEVWQSAAVCPALADGISGCLGQSMADVAARVPMAKTAAKLTVDLPEYVARALLDILLDEINLLRVALSLAPRTLAQLRTAIKNRIDTY